MGVTQGSMHKKVVPPDKFERLEQARTDHNAKHNPSTASEGGSRL
jgi:hypothetical protein